ncbi:MAG: hypothetical protein GY868_21030 [Deltaproteobacteria bacterium]|nr:hypothetical protein [Deltaproteobacteria bacterium]
MRQYLRVSLVLVFVLICCGCASTPHYQIYQGGELPGDEVARLLIAGGILVNKIDDQELSLFSSGRVPNAWHYPDELELLSGPHSVVVTLEGGTLWNTNPSTTLNFTAQAGHTYIVGAIIYLTPQKKQKGWRAVVLDKGEHYEEGCSDKPVYKVKK